MFGYLLDLLSTTISAACRCIIRGKPSDEKTRPLVPLAKYWTVFGVMTIMESLANMLNLPYLIPGYSLLKFSAVIYLYGAGYERVFNNVVSPF
uniref:Receptor expression-enhancing protein n=1 Tax=Ditylenchus dipsaci TaxID=166011 RepID=A0A915E6Q5_9BILA